MEILSPTYYLDACAVIAYLRAESGADILQGIIERPRMLLAMQICNLGGVYYDFLPQTEQKRLKPHGPTH